MKQFAQNMHEFKISNKRIFNYKRGVVKINNHQCKATTYSFVRFVPNRGYVWILVANLSLFFPM